MGLLGWFDSKEADAFARELAQYILAELAAGMDARDAKFKAKAEKTLTRAAGRVEEFRRRSSLNVFTRSKLANRFLWTLKDAGCPPAYATELTEWLTFRL